MCSRIKDSNSTKTNKFAFIVKKFVKIIIKSEKDE